MVVDIAGPSWARAGPAVCRCVGGVAPDIDLDAPPRVILSMLAGPGGAPVPLDRLTSRDDTRGLTTKVFVVIYEGVRNGDRPEVTR